MMTLPSNYMNTAGAAKTNLADSIAPANDQFHGHQADTNLFEGGQEKNPRLFSGRFDNFQQNLSEANNVDSIFVQEQLLNPSCCYPLTLQTQYHGNIHSELFNEALGEIFAQIEKDREQEQQHSFQQIYPFSASTTAAVSNEDISFEKYLTDRGVISQAPKEPLSRVRNSLGPIPTVHNDSNDHDGIIQNHKRMRGSNPDEVEALNRKLLRKRKNREAAKRSNARKQERCLELETELIELRAKNENLKQKLQEMTAEIISGGKNKLRRTKSLP